MQRRNFKKSIRHLSETENGSIDWSIEEKGDKKIFTDMDEMLMAYQDGVASIHARVKVRLYNGPEDKTGSLVESTIGRFIFNQSLPQDLGFVEDRENDPYSLEWDMLCDKKGLGKIIEIFRKVL